MPVEYRALLILAFMIINFLWNKYPRGLITMTCCLLFYITGVLELSEAFNIVTNTTLMIAGLFVAINAVQRTTAMKKLEGVIGILSNKSGNALLIGFLIIVIIFSQFLGTTSSVPLLIAFLCTIPDTGEISVSRLAIPVAGLTAMWQYTFPVGSSLTLPVELNTYYAAMVTDPSQTVGLLDPLKMKLLPCILVTIWTYFGFKLMPKVEANIQSHRKNAKETEKLPLWKEIIIYVVMIADMVGLFLGSKLRKQFQQTAFFRPTYNLSTWKITTWPS